MVNKNIFGWTIETLSIWRSWRIKAHIKEHLINGREVRTNQQYWHKYKSTSLDHCSSKDFYLTSLYQKLGLIWYMNKTRNFGSWYCILENRTSNVSFKRQAHQSRQQRWVDYWQSADSKFDASSRTIILRIKI